MDVRRSQTATGKLMLLIGEECECEAFPTRAAEVVKRFGMRVTEVIDGFEERLVIARIGDAEFCISWDIWIPEVSVMAWGETPDAALEALADQA